MNARRVAALHRELARVHAELADEIGGKAHPVLAGPDAEVRCLACEERAFDGLDGQLLAREVLARYELDWRAPRREDPMIHARRSRAREGVQYVDPLVYFVGVAAGGPIKIGFSADLRARCTALFVGSPVELTLLATEPGGPEVEASLHARFADLRMHGEWFRPGDDLMAYIATMRDGA